MSAILARYQDIIAAIVHNAVVVGVVLWVVVVAAVVGAHTSHVLPTYLPRTIGLLRHRSDLDTLRRKMLPQEKSSMQSIEVTCPTFL